VRTPPTIPSTSPPPSLPRSRLSSPEMPPILPDRSSVRRPWHSGCNQEDMARQFFL
jgi:hypothetical protein